MKGFLAEFKEFAIKGNAVDLAIGVIIGAAFGKIVTSVVNDIVMPLLSLITGKVNFADLFVDFSGKGFATLAEAKAAGAATLNFGVFIQNIIDFLIVALVIFVVVKAMNKLTKGKVAVTPAAK